MTIAELGALGEFVGAFLLFASLIYVGIQIRQSNKTDRMNAMISFENQYRDTVAFFAGSPEVAEIVAKGMVDWAGLGEAEKHLVGPRLYALYRHAEIAFDQHKRGLLDWEEVDRTMKVIGVYHLEPGVQQWFTSGGKLLLSAEFHAFVEGYTAELYGTGFTKAAVWQEPESAV